MWTYIFAISPRTYRNNYQPDSFLAIQEMLRCDAQERTKERVTFLQDLAAIFSEQQQKEHVACCEQIASMLKDQQDNTTTSSSAQQRSKLPDSIVMHMAKQTEMLQELLLSNKNLHYKLDLTVGSERLAKVETVLGKLKFKRKSEMKAFFQDETCKAVLASYVLQASVQKCTHCYDRTIHSPIFFFHLEVRLRTIHRLASRLHGHHYCRGPQAKASLAIKAVSSSFSFLEGTV